MLSSLWKMLGYAIPSAKRPDKYYYLSLIYENYIWSIHGLWPQYADGSYPSYCKKVFFDLQALQPIIDKLNIKWCSDKGTNEKFWQHEWEKHGVVCMIPR